MSSENVFDFFGFSSNPFDVTNLISHPNLITEKTRGVVMNLAERIGACYKNQVHLLVVGYNLIATEEISFLNESDSYCVCFIDMIGSTKVISQIATVPEKIRKYYSIFLNSISTIIKKYVGVI